MRRVAIFVFILLVVTLGLLWHIKRVIETTVSASVFELKNESKESSSLKVTFLDVGQGDAALINFTDGEKMLVDCAVDARILEALGRVMPYYDRQIDYLVVSHPDADHYAGCIDVLAHYNIKNIVYNGMKKESDKLWQWFWESVQKEEAVYHEVDAETIWNISSTSVHFFYPNHPVKDLMKTDLYKNYNGNNLSIVMGLNYNGHQVLFTGDAESGLEKYLVDNFDDKLKSGILKVGHHGSPGSSNKNFLEAVKPDYAIISVGPNTYGHPSERVVKKLERAGAKILRTDKIGDIACRIGQLVECN